MSFLLSLELVHRPVADERLGSVYRITLDYIIISPNTLLSLSSLPTVFLAGPRQLLPGPRQPTPVPFQPAPSKPIVGSLHGSPLWPIHINFGIKLAGAQTGA